MERVPPSVAVLYLNYNAGSPEGTILIMVSILDQISRRVGFQWEIRLSGRARPVPGKRSKFLKLGKTFLTWVRGLNYQVWWLREIWRIFPQHHRNYSSYFFFKYVLPFSSTECRGSLILSISTNQLLFFTKKKKRFVSTCLVLWIKTTLILFLTW